MMTATCRPVRSHCQRWHAITLAVREAIFDRYVSVFGEADCGDG
jgi:hypothetical protein